MHCILVCMQLSVEFVISQIYFWTGCTFCVCFWLLFVSEVTVVTFSDMISALRISFVECWILSNISASSVVVLREDVLEGFRKLWNRSGSGKWVGGQGCDWRSAGVGYFSAFLKRHDKNLQGIMWLGAGVMKKVLVTTRWGKEVLKSSSGCVRVKCRWWTKF